MRGIRKAFLTCLVLGAVLGAAVCALNVSRDYGWSRSVCDGLFVAAVMLLGAGSIRAVYNRGAFDVAGYGLRLAVELAIPALRRANYFLSANIKPTVSLQTIGGCRFHACGKRSGRT